MLQQKNCSNDEKLYAKKYSELPAFSGTRFIFIRDVPELIKHHVKGRVALDYGCGTGHSTIFLKQLGMEVEGMDINRHMIKRAQSADLSVVYRTINSGEVPAPNGHYDFVFSCMVLMHVESKKELLKIMKDVFRVLKPGGTFIFIVNNKDAYNNEWYSLDTRFDENLNICSGSIAKVLFKENNFAVYCCYWSDEDYQDVLEMAGLTLVHTHKPLGTKLDGCPWITEYDKSYVTIFVAQKHST